MHDTSFLTSFLAQSLAPLAQVGTSPTPNDESYAIWAIILIGVAFVLFFLEVFVPSGGLIGFLSAVSLVAGIVMLFRINTTLGLISAIVSLIAVPFLFFFALKLWPNTPIAQLLLLKNASKNQAETQEDPTHNESPDSLVGASGQAITDLHPVGTCLINGHRQQCLAQDGMISRNSRVRVVSADGMEIKVRLER